MRVMLVGGGRRAYFLARRLLDLGREVTLVVESADDARRLAESLPKALVVVGDGARPEVLDDAGALHAEVFVAAATEDHRNLVACQMARRVFDVDRTVAIVEDPENEQVFQRLGVDATICVTDLLTGIVARESALEHLRRLETFGGGRILVSELRLPEDAAAVGATLAELAPEKGLVAAVLRGGDAFVPRGDTRLEAGDRLLVVTTSAGTSVVDRLLGPDRG